MKRQFLFIVMLFIALSAFAQKEDYPGQSAIGYGYDIFDKYASQESIKEQVFDFEKTGQTKYGYQLPYLISITNLGLNKDYIETEGSSLKKYSSSLAASVGVGYDGLVFGGSVEARFGKNASKETSNYFYTISDRTKAWNVYISKSRLKEAAKYLTADAKKAINNWPVNELIDAYGTHVVASGILGGCMDMNLTKSFSSREEGLQVGATVKASFSLVSGEGGVDYEKNSVNEDFKKDLTIFARGGNANYINKSVLDDNSQYNLWVKTIESKSTLIGFDKGSLIPIWELATTATRRSKIKAEFEKRLARNKLPEGNGDAIMMGDVTFYIQSKTTEAYWDLDGIGYAAKTRGGKIGLAKKDATELQGADRFFKIIPIPQSEYVYLQPQHTTDVVTVHDNQSGYHVQLWTKEKGKVAQMFKMIDVRGEDGTYYLQSKQGGFYLAMQGNKVVQLTATEAKRTDAMKWVFENANTLDMAPPSGKFRFKNIAGGKYLDIPGSGKQMQTANGTALIIWDLGFDPKQTIELLPVKSKPNNFFLQPLHSASVFTIYTESKEENVAVVLYTKNSAASQQFQFEYAGSPFTFRIKNVNSNKYLQVDQSHAGVNGTAIIQNSSKGNNSIWKLESIGDYWATNFPKDQKFIIKAAYSNKALSRLGTATNGSVLSPYDNLSTPNQQFKLISTGSSPWFYFQEQGSMKNLDIQGFQNVNNANLIIQQYSGVATQHWVVKPTSFFTCVILSNGFKALTVTSDDKRFILWDLNHDKTQQFQLIYADGLKKGTPFQFNK